MKVESNSSVASKYKKNIPMMKTKTPPNHKAHSAKLDAEDYDENNNDLTLTCLMMMTKIVFMMKMM